MGVMGKRVAREMRSALVEDFRLGQLEYNSVLFNDGGRSILGLVFLSHHQFTFDFPNRRFYLKQLHKKYENATKIDLARYGFVLGQRDGRIVVLSVESGEAAHRKGLRQGDVVRQLSGQNVSFFAATDIIWHRAFIENELQNWSLEIDRGGEILELTFLTKNSD